MKKWMNCTIRNIRSKKTHFAYVEEKGKILTGNTLCGIRIDGNTYQVHSRDMWNATATCKTCDEKERMLKGSDEHWLSVASIMRDRENSGI